MSSDDALAPSGPEPAPAPAPAGPAPVDPTPSDEALAWVEEFALTWEGSSKTPRMEGRILGLLMIVDRPYLSSHQIARLLTASAGAVSGATRKLVDGGFVKRHAVAGDRNHYFRVEDDVWGSWLESERAYLPRLQRVIDDGLAASAGADASQRRRLLNARHYMEWLAGYHRKMLADWEAYRDAQAGTGEP
jgi:DNA-binding transcriptional regulator GbsR (MarR family)